MNLSKKKLELEELLSGVLCGKIAPQKLLNFSWDVIAHFADNKGTDKLPSAIPEETSFWYAIWQSQHLSDSAHLSDSSCRKELEHALSYLCGKKMPNNIFATRP